MNGQDMSLKGLFQSLIPEADGIFQATVISVSPLKVQAINDAKLIIPASLLIVPPHLTDYTREVDIEVGGGTLYGGTDTSDEHSHYLDSFSLTKGRITIKNALKKDEKVHLLSFDKGNKYYILDRVD